MSIPRIAVVTPLFPLRDEPYRGKPIYQTVQAIQQLAEVEVFCPIATYPRSRLVRPLSYQYREPDLSYQPTAINRTHYFSYPALPLVSRSVNWLLAKRGLIPLLRAFLPDVLLAYWLYPEGYAAVEAARTLGVPCVVGARGSDLRAIRDPMVKFWTSRCVRKAAGVLTVSEELRRQAVAMGADPENVRTIVNGCDQSVFFPQNRFEARREFSIDPDAQLVLFVGHLISTKGLNELLLATELLSASHPRLQVVCIGEGGMRAELEASAAQRNLSGRFRLIGPATGPQIARWMAAADVFCLPSYSEGCPNVVLEALACDRPVVATDVGGIPELVNPACGRLVPARSVEPLAQALQAELARKWEPLEIHNRFQRGWDSVAAETLSFCEATMRHHREQKSG